MTTSTTFSKFCTVTGTEYSVTVSEKAVADWRAGTLIQVAMPNLNADQREFLISGTTPAEWDAMFSGGEDA